VRSHKVETSVHGAAVLRHLSAGGQQQKVMFGPVPLPKPAIPPLGPPPDIKIPSETEAEEDSPNVSAEHTQVSLSCYYLPCQLLT